VASQVEEETDGPVDRRVEKLALAKAEAVSARREGLILGADTLVCLHGEILGKPRDQAEAARMLRRISGQVHQVLTGLALVEGARQVCAHQLTAVEMRSLTEAEIQRYVATGEPLDKAGAYGIQGKGAALVKRIDGCFYNVVGLPVSLLVQQLAKFGVEVP
jgi:septum formation protein